MNFTQRQSASLQYQFLDKLGEGYMFNFNQSSFGYIWKVRHIQSGQIYACKLVKNTMKQEKQLLQREIKILQLLKGKKGFTQLVAYGSDVQNTYFVMHLLGENLEQLRTKLGNFNLQTFQSMGLQMITLIRDLHSESIIHRDIKPENFVVYQDKLHLIDFGLSKLYQIDGKHIQYQENKGIIGTARYASINALRGREQSRRDDLESVGYLLLYLQQGSLPWSKIVAEDRNIKYHKILKMKEALNLDQFIGVPQQLIKMFKYVKSLKFEQAPDYQYLIDLFTNDQGKESPKLGIVATPKININQRLLKLKTVQGTPQCHTCRPSPNQQKGGNNSSRRITFEDLSSEGADIIQELRAAEKIKIKHFEIGIKQPNKIYDIQQQQSSKEQDVTDEFNDDLDKYHFKVPKTLLIKQ